METDADGLATRVAFELPQRILWQLLDDFVLVSEMKSAERSFSLSKRRIRSRKVQAAPLAAALKMREQLLGQSVALVLSGGNVTVEQLRNALEKKSPVSGTGI